MDAPAQATRAANWLLQPFCGNIVTPPRKGQYAVATQGSCPVLGLGDYKPWTVHQSGGSGSSDYPEHSSNILSLKKGKARAVQYFADMIEPKLPDNIVIVTIPSHDPANTTGGLKSLAAKLAAGGNRVDGSDCFVRTKKIDKHIHPARCGRRSHS
jgi:hypothetical protein